LNQHLIKVFLALYFYRKNKMAADHPNKIDLLITQNQPDVLTLEHRSIKNSSNLPGRSTIDVDILNCKEGICIF